MNVRLRVEGAERRTTIREAVGDAVRLGRNADCEVSVDPLAFPKVSGVHARLEVSGEGFVLVPVSRSNKTLLNDSPVDGPVPIGVGDRVRLGFTGPTIEIIALESPTTPGLTPIESGETVQADIRHLALLRGTGQVERFEIGGGGVIGRDAGAVQYHLDHPHVSRLHASLALHEGRVVLADLGSDNGTFVNGQRLARPTTLKPGDRIDIGPFSLRFDGSDLVSRSRSNNVELVARGLRRVVRDRATGKPLTLLDDINLVVRPKEFVCLLGPSGSGKSTLLAILSGRNPPSAGTVSVNGEDLYADFEALKGDIAVVPQRDVLHDSLELGQALRYTAELRLPPDTARDEVDSCVSDILEVVGLGHRRSASICHLSGGQVKRASLANELVSRPSLLFLDEVTSGLDEQTDRDVMEVFRQVADGGKTVVCITHSLANVEATCHLVVILTEGGRLAFIGSPDEAKSYFGIARLGDVYRKLAEKPPQHWHDLFRSSPFYRRHVLDRLPATLADEPIRLMPATRRVRRGAGGLRQAGVLIRRYISIWRGDRQTLVAILGQSLLIAVLLGLVFGRLGDLSNPAERLPRTVNLLFMLGVACFWFGCNTSAKELVKERMIFVRERDFNLRVVSYFVSKIMILSLVGVAQASLLFLLVRLWCMPSGSAVLQWLTLATMAVAGTTVGLLISALARSEEVATALVPIAILPQIILAGVIAPLKGLALWLARGFVTVYWGQAGLRALLSDGDPSSCAEKAEPWGRYFPIILVHAIVFSLATIGILVRRERHENA